MNLLMVSLDRKAFEPGDPARERLAGLGEAFDDIRVIVYARRSLGLVSTSIAPNVRLYPTNSGGRFSYIRDAIRIGLEIAGEARPDAVSGQDLGETGLAARRLARRLQVPLQLQDHADVFDPEFAREGLGNRIRALVAGYLARSADCVRAVHPRAAERLAGRIPEAAGRISILPVYVPLERFRAAAFAGILRERYPQFGTVALMASRLVPQKDIGFALRAFARARVPGAGLVILGEGQQRAALERQARRLGIGDRVAFSPWEQDLAPLYAEADLFLLSSRYESYCRTLVEAAAAGLPFVATDVGVARLLADAGAGRTVALDDLDGFARAIGDALSAPRTARTDRATAAISPLAGATFAEHRARYRALLEGCALRTSPV